MWNLWLGGGGAAVSHQPHTHIHTHIHTHKRTHHVFIFDLNPWHHAQVERAGGTFQREALDVMKFKRDEMLVQDGAVFFSTHVFAASLVWVCGKDGSLLLADPPTRHRTRTHTHTHRQRPRQARGNPGGRPQ